VRFLFDTHLVLWAAFEPHRLPRAARTCLDDEATIPILSVVVTWEVAIKAAKPKTNLPGGPGLLRRAMLDRGWEELPIGADHALAAGALPPVHGDPFDRMLIAQATVEGAVLLTADEAVARYPGPVRLVRH
jgi:PIN domain nuclease of toxin-antitoxin system